MQCSGVWAGAAGRQAGRSGIRPTLPTGRWKRSGPSGAPLKLPGRPPPPPPWAPPSLHLQSATTLRGHQHCARGPAADPAVSQRGAVLTLTLEIWGHRARGGRLTGPPRVPAWRKLGEEKKGGRDRATSVGSDARPPSPESSLLGVAVQVTPGDCGVRRGLPRRLLAPSCWADANPRLPACRGECGAAAGGAGHSPLPAGRGAGRGAGAATSQPGIRLSPSLHPREPPPPRLGLTSGLPEAGGTAPPGERRPWARLEERERELEREGSSLGDSPLHLRFGPNVYLERLDFLTFKKTQFLGPTE